MNRFLKIIGIVIIVLSAIILLIAIKADDYIEGKISESLKDLPDHISISYETMEFNTFKGDLIFTNSKIEFKNDRVDSVSSVIEIKDIAILDIDYWEYFKNKNFVIQDLKLNNPKLFHKQLSIPKDSTYTDTKTTTTDSNWQQYILIRSFEVSNGSVDIRNATSDSLILSTVNNDILIKNVKIDSTVGDLIPFKYDSYSGTLKNLFYKVGEYEGLTIERITFKPDDIRLNAIAIKTKYPKKEYDRILVEERDWYNITMDSLWLIKPYFGKRNDSITHFKSDTAYVYQPYIEIYRNKLISDEHKFKPYYSQLLRELNFDLTLNTIVLENGYVAYEEKVLQGHEAGKLDFSEFYATVYNFGNTYTDTVQTTLNINSKFMETTPLKVDWVFNAHNRDDTYSFKGELGGINTQVLNQFTNNTLNVRLEGILHKTYFNIEGNDHGSTIDLRINYDQFKIHLINDKNRPKKLLNAVVNIFIKKDSESDEGSFRDVSASVKRNKYGSFYNNLWLNLEAGLKEAITGDDK